MSKKKYSSYVTNGADKAPNRAMLRAVGFTNSDFKKPIVGVASTWAMVTPCNMHWLEHYIFPSIDGSGAWGCGLRAEWYSLSEGGWPASQPGASLPAPCQKLYVSFQSWVLFVKVNFLADSIVKNKGNIKNFCLPKDQIFE